MSPRRSGTIATVASAARLLVVVLLAFASLPARADSHAVIDQAVLEPSTLGGQRLRVYVSALSLEGQLLEVGEAGTPRLFVNGHRLDLAYALGTYGELPNADTAIVVMIQSSFDFTDVLPVIVEALDSELLQVAGDHAQVAIVPYGETIPKVKLTSLGEARSKARGMIGDGSTGEPVLLDTLERVLSLLDKATTKPPGRPLRKMVLIVGDGRDVDADRSRVTRIGKRAGRAGIRIHSMAYSPQDIRRPLLLLGELSRQSLGTFRWIRGDKADSWTPAFRQLASELREQSVITVFLPDGEDVSGKKLEVKLVGRTELTALNSLRIPDVGCDGKTCEAGAYCAADRCVMPQASAGRGVLGWVLLIGGIVVGVLVVLGVIGFIIAKRQHLAAQIGVPGTPGAPGIPGMPGQVAPGQVVPGQVAPGQVPRGRAPGSTLIAQAPGQAFASQPPAGGARLYVMSGPLAGREFPLKHGFFIGKQSSCDLVIDDGYTSSHHAQFVMDGQGGYRLFDYNSTNGTFVDGQRVQDIVLAPGATIRIGQVEIRYLVG